MAHIFKPGDRAYDIESEAWVELEKNPDPTSEVYLLKVKGESEVFTEDGRSYWRDTQGVLFPYNPYDLSDPNNPPEFSYPFMLNGRPVKVGDELYLPYFKQTAKVISLSVDIDRKFCTVSQYPPFKLSDKYFRWPDELSVKKKVAKWAYPICGIPGIITVGFTEETTEEEARKAYGSSVQMIPGTEREVEE